MFTDKYVQLKYFVTIYILKRFLNLTFKIGLYIMKIALINMQGIKEKGFFLPVKKKSRTIYNVNFIDMVNIKELNKELKQIAL